MIEVPRNHFYKKVPFTANVQLKYQFSDLPSTAGEDIRFSNISNINNILLTGNVPALPTYGDSTVTGGVMQVYGADIDTKNTRDKANFQLYGVAPDVVIDEGGFSLAHKSGSAAQDEVGHQISVYNSIPVGSIYKYENFEAAILDTSAIQRMGGGSVQTYHEPYIRFADFINFFNKYNGTDYTWTSQFAHSLSTYDYMPIEVDHERGSRNANPKNPLTAPAGIYTVKAPARGTADAQIKIEFKSNKSRVKVRTRRRDSTVNTYGTIYDFAEIQHLIKFRSVESTITNLTSSPTATSTNTIFDTIFATANGPGPFDSTVENPMTMTNVELSSENSIDGGQALRFYHNWGYSLRNPVLQNTFGVSGNLNPQCAYASLYNIPLPPAPFDIGRNTFSATDTTPVYGNHRSVCSEIQMSMNITKLSPNVLVNISGCAALNENPYSYYQQDNTSLPYASCGKEAYTFLRSVVVTFSNYKPKSNHTTVDKFINYGLDRFYGGETSDQIVGGVVFYADNIGGEIEAMCDGKDEQLYAMPIPVTKVRQCVSGTTATTSTILGEGGMARLSGSSGGVLPNMDTLTWGNNRPNVGAARSGLLPQFVNVPSNSWINMRIFINPDFYNNVSSATLNPYSGSLAYSSVSERGSSMRIYFGLEGESESSDSPLSNIPCLDIPFPATNLVGTVPDSYRWTDSPSKFPQHMTVWVQNYPWVSSAAGESPADDLFYRADSQVLTSGASREVEVFIDNIKLLNFTPNTTNNTADSSVGRVVFKGGDIYSPIGTLFAPLAIAPYIAQNTYQTAWVTDKTSLTPRSGSNNAGDIANYQGGSYYNYDYGQSILFGFDEKSDLPISSDAYSTNAMGYLLFNDFRTTDYTTLKGVAAASGYSTNAYFKNRLFTDRGDATQSGGIFSQLTSATNHTATTKTINLGKQLMAATYYVKGSASGDAASASDWDFVSGSLYKIDPTGTTGTDDAFSLGSQTNSFLSTNAFREKGFVRASVSGATYTAWIKREHILASTKIVSMAETTVDNFQGLGPVEVDSSLNVLNRNAIVVHDPTLFNYSNENETYVIYLMNAAPGGWLGASATMRTGLKLDTFLQSEDNTITFDAEITLADDGATPLVTDANLPRLWVGPEKYWLTMLLDTPADITPRSYDNICTINETPSTGSLTTQLGATVNEWEYNYTTAGQVGITSALYNNIWSPDFSVGADMIIIDQDFGYGAYDEELGTGGQVSDTQLLYTRFNYFNLDTYLKDKIPDSTEPYPIPLMMRMDGGSDVQSFTIKGVASTEGSVDDTSYRPYLYVQYQDKPPVLSNLSVQPAFDVLSGDTNLYELTTENLNALSFTWDEENADDIWYRMLMVDTKPIRDKYVNAIMWLPLNEKPPTVISEPTYSVYNPTNIATGSYAASGAATVGEYVRGVVEGQGGYAAVVNPSGNSNQGKIIIPNATNNALDDLTEFTLVAHWTPALDDLNNQRYIITQSDNYTSGNNFFLHKNTDNQIVVEMGSSVALTGTTSIECDGNVPTSIIMTFNSGSAMVDKARLFINGALEDTSTGTTNVAGSNDFTLGGRYDATKEGTRGKLEEIIIYNKEYNVIDKGGEYIFNTANILDGNVTGGVMESLYTQNARLFAMDYHNFRGHSSKELGMSSTLSWRATTL